MNGALSPEVIPMTDHALGATFAVRVQARAGRTAIAGAVGDALKLSVSAPPFEGRANACLTEFFSELFSVPRGAVQVVAGELSRNKVIRIQGRSAAELRQRMREHFTV